METGNRGTTSLFPKQIKINTTKFSPQGLRKELSSTFLTLL